jgi:hypothetical protein
LAVVFASPIHLRHKLTDFPSSTATSAPSTKIESSKSASQALQPDQGSSGISTKAIVAIAVAIPVAVIAGSFIVFFIFRRRRRAHVRNYPDAFTPSKTGNTPYAPPLVEAPISEVHVSPSELAAIPASKTVSYKPVAELDGLGVNGL